MNYTNQKAEGRLVENSQTNNHQKPWENCTVSEIKCFLLSNYTQRESNSTEECQLGHYDDNRKSDCAYCSNRSIGEMRATTTWFCLSCNICVCPKCSILHFKEK